MCERVSGIGGVMAKVTLAQNCKVCSAPLPFRAQRRGRPREYCSRSCRSQLEQQRKAWDSQRELVGETGFYAINRDASWTTPTQRAHWQAQLDEAKAEFSTKGPRP